MISTQQSDPLSPTSTADAETTVRLPVPDGSRRGASPRRPWLPLVAALAAGALVLGSATWWTLRKDHPVVAAATAAPSVPWDATAMKPGAAVVSTSSLGWGDVPAGTPECTAADLEVVSTATTGPTGTEPMMLTTDVGLRSVGTAPCRLLNRGGARLMGPDGPVPTPPGSTGTVAGPAIFSLLVSPGQLLHLGVSWWTPPGGIHPLRLEVLEITEQATTTEPLSSLDVSTVALPAPDYPAPEAGSPEPLRWDAWSVTSSPVTPGTLASLTAQVKHLTSTAGESTATLHLTNDTGTTVSLAPCPDLVVSAASVGDTQGTTLRGPLGCTVAPSSLQPGDQLDVALRLDVSLSPSSLMKQPVTAELVRGDDVVTSSAG